MLVEDLKNVLADLAKLGLDLLAVFFDKPDLSLIALGLLLLFDGSHDPPGRTSCPNNVLVGNR